MVALHIIFNLYWRFTLARDFFKDEIQAHKCDAKFLQIIFYVNWTCTSWNSPCIFIWINIEIGFSEIRLGPLSTAINQLIKIETLPHPQNSNSRNAKHRHKDTHTHTHHTLEHFWTLNEVKNHPTKTCYFMYCFPCSAQINSFACILLANMLEHQFRATTTVRTTATDSFLPLGTQSAQKHLDIVDSIHTSMEFSLKNPQQKVH